MRLSLSSNSLALYRQVSRLWVARIHQFTCQVGQILVDCSLHIRRWGYRAFTEQGISIHEHVRRPGWGGEVPLKAGVAVLQVLDKPGLIGG